MKKITNKIELVALALALGVRADWKDSDEVNVNVKHVKGEFNRGGSWGYEAALHDTTQQQFLAFYKDGTLVAEANFCDVLGFAIEPTPEPVTIEADAIPAHEVFEDPDLRDWLYQSLKIQEPEYLELNIINYDCSHVYNATPGLSERDQNHLLTVDEGKGKVYLVNAEGRHEWEMNDPREAFNEVVDVIRRYVERESAYEVHEALESLSNSGEININIQSAETIFKDCLENRNGGRVDWKDLSEDLGFDTDDVIYQNIEENAENQGDESLINAAENHFNYNATDIFDNFIEELDGRDIVKIARKMLDPGEIADDLLESASKHLA